MKERAVVFGRSHPLVGVISEPQARDSKSPAGVDLAGVVILNSGLDHRVGTSRLSVRIARRLCNRGHWVARFDHNGIGDSPATTSKQSDRTATQVAEAREVMDELQRDYDIERFVLVGLCSGAVTAFKGTLADPRVVGAIMMNSHGLDGSAEWHEYVKSRRRARMYWTKSIRDWSNWRRALTGGIDYPRLFRSLGPTLAARLNPSSRVASLNRKLSEELRQIAERGVHLLLVFTPGDDSEEYFNVIAANQRDELSASNNVQIENVTNSDHTFSLLPMQLELFRIIDPWLPRVDREHRRPETEPSAPLHPTA